MTEECMDSWTTELGTEVRIEWDHDCPSPIEAEELVSLNLYHRDYLLGNSLHKTVEDYQRWKDGLLEAQAEEWCEDPDHPLRQRLTEKLREVYEEELSELEQQLREEEQTEGEIRRLTDEQTWDHLYDWFGDDWFREMTAEEQDQAWDELGYKFWPVYAYIHSGITISLGPFSCPWDSGQLGEASVSRQDWLKYMGSLNGWDDPKRVQEAVEGVVEAYDLYLTGQCFYVHCEWTDPETGTTFEDSCGGFIGDEYAQDEAKRTAEWVDKQVQEFKKNSLVGAGI